MACADAPITAADIQADGQLRSAPSSQQSVHATRDLTPAPQRAELLRVTGLLAAQAEGPLEDATRFALTSDAIYLHLRADDLHEPRPVTFVWTHEGEGVEHQRETMGFLQPSETISLAASLPLVRYREEAEEAAAAPRGTARATRAALDAIQPADPVDPIERVTGDWRVEVYSTDASGGRSLLFEREFEVIDADAYEAQLAEALADAGAAGVAD